MLSIFTLLINIDVLKRNTFLLKDMSVTKNYATLAKFNLSYLNEIWYNI